MTSTTKPAFDYTRPDVVNGGFTISFDRDHTGPLITIACPAGHVFKLWEKGTDTDRPVIYGWAEPETADTNNEPDWMIVTPRRGRAVSRVEFGQVALIVVERSYDDHDEADGDFFYTIHSIAIDSGDAAQRAAEDADQEDGPKYTNWAEACVALSNELIKLGKAA